MTASMMKPRAWIDEWNPKLGSTDGFVGGMDREIGGMGRSWAMRSGWRWRKKRAYKESGGRKKGSRTHLQFEAD